MTDVGTEYLGFQSVTASGEKCINWTLTEYPDLESNFCRNVDKRSSGPWCVTENQQEKSCNIPFCKRECTDTIVFMTVDII